MGHKKPEATEAVVGAENLESIFRRPEPLAKEVGGKSDGRRGQKLIKAIWYFTNVSRTGAVRHQQLPSSISIFESATGERSTPSSRRSQAPQRSPPAR